MDALTNLQQRFSQPLLQEPGPDAEQLDNMFAAAMRKALRLSRSPLQLIPFSYWVKTLTTFHWPPTAGMKCRVKLLFPTQVRAVLIRAFLAQDAETVHKNTRVKATTRVFDWLPNYGPFF